MLLGELVTGGDRTALRFADAELTYRELAGLAGHAAGGLLGRERVAVWATPTIETCVAVVATLAAGAAVVPVNPKIGERELTHILADSEPDVVLSAPNVELPEPLAARPRLPVLLAPADAPVPPLPPEPDEEAPAFVVYTSGTTGPPKGVVLPRRAVATNLDALAEAWGWTGDDVLVHGLPLFHVHGLIIGVVGPLRRGGSLRHLGKFSSSGAGTELARDATMLFGVPTMYHRIAREAEGDESIVAGLRSARLLVSGSAPLPSPRRWTTITPCGCASSSRAGAMRICRRTWCAR